MLNVNEILEEYQYLCMENLSQIFTNQLKRGKYALPPIFLKLKSNKSSVHS